MPHYQYLILGGGMTADAAVKAIRETDEAGSIGLISSETNPPYKRPPLTKGLWKGKQEDSIFLHTADHGLELHLGCSITGLDAQNKRLSGADGAEYTFDKLLLATGGTPRPLGFGPEGIIYYRTLDDYHSLRALTEGGDEFVVIGGGFIGSEIAAALAMNGKHPTMIFPDTGIGARVYPRELSNHLFDYFRERGVEVVAGDIPTEIIESSGRYVVKTKGGREVAADGVIAGIGITPNVGLAESAGLHASNGIVVDEFMQTNRPDIYAAGDVANYYDPVLDKRRRVEHEDNAVTMGGYAGRSMAGQGEPYHHMPYFYSDLFDLGYEAVGDLDSSLETFADWREPFVKGVIYYMQDGRVRGVLLWNVWDSVPAARELIKQPGPFSEDDLRGKIGG